jgi:DNA-binding NtrC family response regulator
MPHLPRTPQSIVILDRRPEYARLLVALAAAEAPTLAVAAFDDLGTAERWVAAAETPVAVFVDVLAHDGEAIRRAEAWRSVRAGVMLVAMFDANEDEQAERAAAVSADATFAKPCCRSVWSRSFAALLREPEPVAV